MRQFGLIGYPLGHSFSRSYFSGKFIKEGIADCSYENFPIPSIGHFSNLVSENPGLLGLNVTIPYKRAVIDFLDDRGKNLPVGACNCIKITNGKTAGYNTDVTGFEISLNGHLRPYHRQALVLGNGGAAEAVQYVLKKSGIGFLVVSRQKKEGVDLTYSDLNAEIINEHLLIINTTPLGTYPRVDECPPIPYAFLTPRHYLFDLVYNPEKTRFLEYGETSGATICNGYEMLVIQAEESWKIWNADL